MARGFPLVVTLGVSLLPQCSSPDLDIPNGHIASAVWRSTGVMSVTRTRHSATLLPTGKVLVAGGFFEDTSTGGVKYLPLSTAELFDPITGQFQPTGSKITATAIHAATQLPSGIILFTGGTEFNTTKYGGISNVEFYDPVSGQFSPGPAMHVGRRAHAMTVLPSGKVLITGGADEDGSPGKSAELYDPSTSSFELVGAMGRGRLSHTSTLLPSGKVLIVGGASISSSPFDESAEIYDPSTKQFSPVGSMAAKRANHSATLVDSGHVLVMGGRDPDGPTIAAESYDPDTGQFVTISAAMQQRSGHTATLLPSGKILLTGGYASPSDLTPMKVTEIVTVGKDGTTVTVATGGEMNAPRASHASTLLPSGVVLLTGGRSGTGTTAEIFDPQDTHASNSTTPVPQCLGCAVSVLPTGEVFISGGLDISSSTPLSTSIFLVPNSGSTTNGPSLTIPRWSHTSTTLTSGDVLIAGGRTVASQPTNSVERFDVASSTFVPSGSLVHARSQHTATILSSGKVLFVGGSATDFESISAVEEYDPKTGTSTQVAELAFPRKNHLALRLASGKILIAGGSNEQSGAITSIEIYDPATQQISVRGEFATTAATTLGDGTVLLLDAFRQTTADDKGPRTQVGEGLSFASAAVPTISGGALVCSADGCSTRGSWDSAITAVPNTPSPTAQLIGLQNGEILRLDAYATSTYLITPSPDGVRRPYLDKSIVPTTLIPGSRVYLYGQGFQRASTAGATSTFEDPARMPLVFFLPTNGGGPLFGTVREWSNNVLAWTPPRSGFAGPGTLHVVVDGVASVGVFTALETQPRGAECANDGECRSGHCALDCEDGNCLGLCCDQKCESGCMSCRADELVVGSEDGICHPIAPFEHARFGCLPTSSACSPIDQMCLLGDCYYSNAPCETADGVKGFCQRGQCGLAPSSKCSEDGLSEVSTTGDAKSCLTYRCKSVATGFTSCGDGANDTPCVKGSCATSCTRQSDCAPGARCTSDGECVTDPGRRDTPDPGACSLPRSPSHQDSPAGWFFGYIIAAYAIRRRARGKNRAA